MDAKEEVRARLAIEDVVSEYVQLKRSGRNFKGLSPFSNEKTPSFIVSPEKQIWHDFSSGRGGDLFSFIMEMEGLEFKEALELLARRAGIDIDQISVAPGNTSGLFKKRLHNVNDAAAKFYQAHFTKNQAALNYVFKKRAFTKQTVLDFRLGYSPDSGQALYKYLKKNNFTEQEIKTAGLVTVRYGETSDMFRGRLMIPLMDAQGLVVGFTARLLSQNDKAPKYINTPSTPVYDKSRHVYGLNLAKESIRKQNEAIIVEGNLDVIAAHQVGTRHVIATAGTAITQYHLKIISRFTQEVKMCFDQDSAGQAATERAIPLANKLGISLKIISLPAGKDPDELIKKDKKLWEQIIMGGDYALDWLIARYESQLDIKSADGKRKFSSAMSEILKNLEDKVEQDHYVNLMSEKLVVSADSIRQKMSGATKPTQLKRGNIRAELQEKTFLESKKAEDHLLTLTMHNLELVPLLKILSSKMISQDDAKQLFGILKTYEVKKEGKIAPKELHKIKEYARILELQYETLYQPLDDVELRYEAIRQRKSLVERYVKSQKIMISQKIQNSDEKNTAKLLSEARELDKLLGGLKEE